MKSRSPKRMRGKTSGNLGVGPNVHVATKLLSCRVHREGPNAEIMAQVGRLR